MRSVYNTGFAIGLIVTFIIIWFLVFLFLFEVLGGGSPRIAFTCATKGAQIHSRDTKNGLYSTVWCVKNGRVVP
jgi:hypothetical protein